MDNKPKCKKNYKTLKGNIGTNLYDLGLDKAFLDIASKTQAKKKKKTDKLDNIKIKNLCAANGISREVKTTRIGKNIYKSYI